MTDDSPQARKERAESIRKRIDELNAPPPPASPPHKEDSQQPPESPAEFIHRKMRDWDAKK